MTLAFEELWEPRTAETGVYGIVTPPPTVQTPDGSDPQLPWASKDALKKRPIFELAAG